MAAAGPFAAASSLPEDLRADSFGRALSLTGRTASLTSRHASLTGRAGSLTGRAGSLTGRHASLTGRGRQLSTVLSAALQSAASAAAAAGIGALAPRPVEHPAAWKAADWAGREREFVLELDDDDVAALDAAVAALQAAGTPLESLKRASDFPLPAALSARLAAMRADLLVGRGFALVRGLPTARWSEWQSLAAYLGVGAHMGYRGPQSKDGKLVNHVKVHYGAAGRPAQREHANNDEFGPHTDAQADVLALLCLQQAREGGVSSWASTLSVHNEMLARGRADLVAAMAGGGWYRDRSRYQDLPAGARPVWSVPVFSYGRDGRLLAVNYNASHYHLCARKYAGCQLSERQLEAIELFESIAAEPKFSMRFRMQPGDALFLNNSHALHARSAFVDGDAPHERRHLVRLWLGVDPDVAAAAGRAPSSSPPPAHLAFPRAYTGFDESAFDGLMRPRPETFHVPLSADADDV